MLLNNAANIFADMFNTNDLQRIATSTPLYYLEIEPNIDEVPVESRAIPLNAPVNVSIIYFLFARPDFAQLVYHPFEKQDIWCNHSEYVCNIYELD